MMLTLGSYRFSVNTAAYQTKSRSTTYRWGNDNQLDAESNHPLQYIGLGDDKITIKGVIYPHYRGGLIQLELMRQEATHGESLLLIDGKGKVLGRWVIESINDDQSFFYQDGIPKRIDFTLTLRKCSDYLPDNSDNTAEPDNSAGPAQNDLPDN